MEKSKLIAAYKTKPVAVNGSQCHIHYNIYSDGIILIEKRMFISEPPSDRQDWELIREFMGKAYCKQSMAFKYRTLANILHTATTELMDANIKREDLA